MFEVILIGGSFAFAAAMQPGPLQAFLLSRVAADGWRRTLPAALAPVISDGPIAFLVLVVLHNVARGFESALRGVGGLVFAFFAVRAFAQWWSVSEESVGGNQSSPRTLAQAVVVNFLNPGPYLGWSLILGPLALEAWARSPALAIALVCSFYLVMVASLSLFILLLATTSFLGHRGRQNLLLVSAFALAGISVYSLWSALG